MAGYKRVRAGLERALKAGRDEGIITDREAGLVAAARVLADRIDQDLPGDNVSASVFLKYMQSLGLTPVSRSVAPNVPKKTRLQELQDAVAPWSYGGAAPDLQVVE